MADGKFLVGKPSGGVTTVTVADGAANTNLVLPESGTVSSVDSGVTDNAIARYDGTTGKLQNSGVSIDDNGNVGIGTSSPSNLFEINRTTALSDTEITNGRGTIYLNSSSNATNSTGQILNSISFSGQGTSRRRAMIANLQSASTATGGDLAFYTTATGTATDAVTESMRIDSTGNLLLKSGTGALGYGTGAGGTVTQLTSKSTAVTLNKPSGTITMNNAALAASSSVAFRLYNSLCSNGDVCVIAPADGNYSVISIVENGSVYIRVTNITASTLSDVLFVKYTIIKGVTA